MYPSKRSGLPGRKTTYSYPFTFSCTVNRFFVYENANRFAENVYGF
jgi:hypothetical protein